MKPFIGSEVKPFLYQNVWALNYYAVQYFKKLSRVYSAKLLLKNFFIY